MPGNEVGDTIQNFFVQENLSQGQQYSQIVDRTWPSLSNNPWAGADSENGHGDQSSGMQHGTDFSQPSSRPEFARYQQQSQQPSLNGYMHGHQVFQARQNEENFMGLGTEFDRHNLISRGFSVFDSQLGNGPDLLQKNSVRMDFTESPVNYDFFGGQPQMNVQHPVMMQSLPRQQSEISDMQILRQQFMLKQMLESQRQQQYQKQQYQQQDARQLNSMNQISSFAKPVTGSHSTAMIHGVPIHDKSNYLLKPELMEANSSWRWPQHGASQFVQVSSGEFIFSPDQVHASHSMGMVPQQVDQSLHGVPVSVTRVTSSQYSPIKMDKPIKQQLSGTNTSFHGNQYTGSPDQVSMNDEALASRQEYRGKNMIVDGQDLNCGINLVNVLQVNLNPQQSETAGPDFSWRREVANLSETPQDKEVILVSSSQNVATLDPAEEKILFGSDDNLWESFGKSTNMSDGGTDFLAFPSIQSGSWSALMQSAVAETSSCDAGQQAEGIDVNFHNNEPTVGNLRNLNLNGSGEHQLSWTNSGLQTSSTTSQCNHSNIPAVKQSGLHEQNESLLASSSPSFTQHIPLEQAERLNSSFPQKSVAQGSHIFRKFSHSSEAESHASTSSSWTNQQSMPLYNTGGKQSSRPNGWNLFDSMSPMGATRKNRANENSLQASQSTDQKSPSPTFKAADSGTDTWKTDSFSNSAVNLGKAKSAIGSPKVNTDDSPLNNVSKLPDSSTIRADQSITQPFLSSDNNDIWKQVGSSVHPKGSDFTGKYQSQTNKGHSTGNNSLGNGIIENHGLHNSNAKESTYDSFHNVSSHTSTVRLKENSWLDASDSNTLSGGKPKSSSHIGRKLPGRKFQYHPMGDLDVDLETSYETKLITRPQSMMQQLSQRLKGHDQRFSSQSKFTGQMARDTMEVEKDQCSDIKGDSEGLDGAPLKNMLPGSTPSTSVPHDRAFNNYSTNKTMPSSQNMFELFHKVDHSREHKNAIQDSSSDHNQPSERPEARISDGSVHFQLTQSSASQGFSLQLAPPSQMFPLQDRAFSSQGYLLKSNSTSKSLVTSDVGEKGHKWLASTSSFHSIPPSHETSPGGLGNNISGTLGQTGNKAQGSSCDTVSAGFPCSGTNLQKRNTTEIGGQPDVNQSVNTSFDSFTFLSKQMNESSEKSQTSQSALASMTDMSRKTSHPNITSSAEISQPFGENQKHAGEATQKFPVLEAAQVSHYSVSGTSGDDDSPKKSSVVWTDVSIQQHSFGAQPQHFKAPDNLFKSNLNSSNSSETFSQSQRLENQNEQMKENGPSESGACSVNSLDLAGKEQMVKGERWQKVSAEGPAQTTMSASQERELSGLCLSSPASPKGEIEASGRSLRPNNNLHENYSLLHHIQSMKNAEVDLGNRSLKISKGPEGAVDSQLVGPQGGQQLHGYNNMAREAATSHTSTLSGDSKMLKFLAKRADNQDTHESSGNMFTCGQNNPNNFPRDDGLASLTGEYSQISAQMTPSWFDRYGTLKNGQILPMYDAQKTAAMKLPSSVGRPTDGFHAHDTREQRTALAADVDQHGIVQKSSTASLPENAHLSSHLFSPDTASASVVVVQAKKRKSVTSEFLPWYKEVTHVPIKLQNISTVEMNWAQAANRLPEKVEDETDVIEVGPPHNKSRRRLILTTQLMQLLLMPPPTSILFTDSISHHESVAQFTARSTLRDACSALSFTGSDTSLPSSSGNILPENLKISDRIGHHFFSRVVEDLISRTKKVENDLLRLNKTASVLDLRVECQDLEKFSVINRFAKFHARGQPDGPETSLSPDSPANTLKNAPQRYVIALPMPRNVPDRCCQMHLPRHQCEVRLECLFNPLYDRP